MRRRRHGIDTGCLARDHLGKTERCLRENRQKGANCLLTHAQVRVVGTRALLLSGAGLAFSRAIGEYGSVVLIGGAVPGKTEVSSQYIRQLIEFDDRTGAAAVSIVLLVISFVILFILRTIGSRAAKREELSA